VECPLKGLDMARFVPFPEFLKGEETIYDLYAVINHFGIMQAGHYTCCVKNEQ
jgi:ubiquitin C-terminal hydrolase